MKPTQEQVKEWVKKSDIATYGIGYTAWEGQLERFAALAYAAGQAAERAKMPPADLDDGFVGRIDDAITESLGDAMDCTRVWSAWGYGTMDEDDFVRVADDPCRVMEIRDAVLRVVRATEEGGAA